jgi:hypothetical protein
MLIAVAIISGATFVLFVLIGVAVVLSVVNRLR